MASNPRKFSEKIALHNQKQMEETAAFEKIMREVSHATSKVTMCLHTSEATANLIDLITIKHKTWVSICNSDCEK